MCKKLALPMPGVLPGKMRMTCLDCAKVFGIPASLKKHMVATHMEPHDVFLPQEDNYLDLPECKVTDDQNI